MKPWIAVPAGIATAAALFVVAAERDIPAPAMYRDETTALRPVSQQVPSNPPVEKTGHVPARSHESRNTDVSMATRIGSCAPTGEMPTVNVSGMVVQPCTIPLTEGLTLGQAIKKAGGATEFASPKRVVIYRDGRQAAYDRTDERTLAIQLKRGDSVQVSGRPMEPR